MGGKGRGRGRKGRKGEGREGRRGGRGKEGKRKEEKGCVMAFGGMDAPDTFLVPAKVVGQGHMLYCLNNNPTLSVICCMLKVYSIDEAL